MGASGWSYFTPYDEDPERALQRLRKEVFESGQYGEAARMGPSDQDLAAMPPEMRAAMEQMREQLKPQVDALRALEEERIGGGAGRFKTIAELLEAAGADGTHSILDIQRTGYTPGFGIASPADPDAVEEVFGTTHPTHTEILGKEGQLSEDLDRWQAVYLVVYAEGRPAEIYFEGVSGD